jgi:sulfite reductase (ferredoxin)
VSFVQFGLQKSELEVFEAQVLLDEGKNDDAATRAYRAMLEAARALAKEKNANLGEEPEEIVREFKQHWVETKLFWDPFAGAKFAQYLFKAHEEAGGKTHSKESAHQLIEEAQLFVDAAHQAHTRIGTALPFGLHGKRTDP